MGYISWPPSLHKCRFHLGFSLAGGLSKAHLTGRNQELSSARHNSNGKLHYSWAVNLDASM